MVTKTYGKLRIVSFAPFDHARKLFPIPNRIALIVTHDNKAEYRFFIQAFNAVRD
jgi:hypothetical protein